MGGRLLGGVNSGAQPMMIAAPMNDIQLMALVAAQRPDLPPQEAVAWAAEIVAEAIVQHKNLPALARQKAGAE